MIWFSSDLHIGHDKDFIYKPRGFDSIEEHDKILLSNWNSIVSEDDTVYLLGDLMLNDNEHGIDLLKRLNGHIELIIIGNHDTDTRIDLYHKEICKLTRYAVLLQDKKWRFFLSHYPTITANFDDNKRHLPLMNLFGHTHQKDMFYNNNPYMYNVGLDAHNMFPVNLEQIKEDIRNKVREND